MKQPDWDHVATEARNAWQSADVNVVGEQDFTTGFFAGYLRGAFDSPGLSGLPGLEELTEALVAAESQTFPTFVHYTEFVIKKLREAGS